MVFYILLGLVFVAVLWIIYRVRISNHQDDMKGLAKSWRERMPQQIKEYRDDATKSTTRSTQPIISDTSRVAVRNSGPDTIKKVSQVEQGKEQFKLFGDLNESKHELENVNNLNKEIYEKPQTDNVSLLKAYVCDATGGFLDPQKLVSALNIAGLSFGEMDIFHYYHEESTKPAFSAASMHEPGTFDLERLQLVRTSGIVMFISSTSIESWPEDFRLMLTAAKRVAASLEAVLYSAPEVLWTEEHEQTIATKLGISSD
jgi:FtsZ-interacting cell division protein ZipA